MKKKLTKREKQIVALLLAEYSIPEIANALDIHPNTANDTKRRAMEKLGTNNVIGLLKACLRFGIMSMEDLIEPLSEDEGDYSGQLSAA